MKATREATISAVADILILTNLRNRGAEYDATVSEGVGVLSDHMNALMTDGDALKTKEREAFTKVWASYVNSSGAKVPGTDTSYEALN